MDVEQRDFRRLNPLQTSTTRMPIHWCPKQQTAAVAANSPVDVNWCFEPVGKTYFGLAAADIIQTQTLPDSSKLCRSRESFREHFRSKAASLLISVFTGAHFSFLPFSFPGYFSSSVQKKPMGLGDQEMRSFITFRLVNVIRILLVSGKVLVWCI